MPEVITNTSPLLYLYRIERLDWLPRLFHSIWTPGAVVEELREGRQRGYEVPDPTDYAWLQIVDPHHIPSNWLSLDLGAGERSTLALALENPDRIALLDDQFAREVAQAAGLNRWGTLKVLLEAKSQGMTPVIRPWVDRLSESGMWISAEVRQRILVLADEREER